MPRQFKHDVPRRLLPGQGAGAEGTGARARAAVRMRMGRRVDPITYLSCRPTLPCC
jgi:hypothetical protein